MADANVVRYQISAARCSVPWFQTLSAMGQSFQLGLRQKLQLNEKPFGEPRFAAWAVRVCRMVQPKPSFRRRQRAKTRRGHVDVSHRAHMVGARCSGKVIFDHESEQVLYKIGIREADQIQRILNIGECRCMETVVACGPVLIVPQLSFAAC